MRKAALPILIVVSLYLDTIFFAKVNLFEIRPDMLLAVIVSAGMLMGSAPGALLGACIGLLVDVVFGKYVGLTALMYMLAGLVAGIFYKKFYADNIIVPAVVAAVFALIKDFVTGLILIIVGGNVNFNLMIVRYIIPCAIMSAASCMLVHLILKQSARSRLKHNI